MQSRRQSRSGEASVLCLLQLQTLVLWASCQLVELSIDKSLAHLLTIITRVASSAPSGMALEVYGAIEDLAAGPNTRCTVPA